MNSSEPKDNCDNLHNEEPPTALLVIAYLRPKNLQLILDSAISANLKDIYISIDFPKIPSEENLKLNSQVVSIARRYKENSNLDVTINVRNENVGCSAAVLSSCDWFFENVKQGIILEDDCMPTQDFFRFCEDAIAVMQSLEDVWVACGTQFAPRTSGDSWLLSKYPLTWGWATTRKKWEQISDSLQDSKHCLRRSNINKSSVSEATYWDAGSRRAEKGISDAWDTPLVQRMILNSKLAILPRVPLVSNIGNDQFATHTRGNSLGLGLQTGEYKRTDAIPSRDFTVDTWLRENFFKISMRHILSTKFTNALDILLLREQKGMGLIDRWKLAKIMH